MGRAGLLKLRRVIRRRRLRLLQLQADAVEVLLQRAVGMVELRPLAVELVFSSSSGAQLPLDRLPSLRLE